MIEKYMYCTIFFITSTKDHLSNLIIFFKLIFEVNNKIRVVHRLRLENRKIECCIILAFFEYDSHRV